MTQLQCELEMIMALYPGARANLIRAREERGLHPREVAERLGVSYPYYRGIELGKNTPERELTERIGKLLQMDADELMRGGEEK